MQPRGSERPVTGADGCSSALLGTAASEEHCVRRVRGRRDGNVVSETQQRDTEWSNVSERHVCIVEEGEQRVEAGDLEGESEAKRVREGAGFDETRDDGEVRSWWNVADITFQRDWEDVFIWWWS